MSEGKGLHKLSKSDLLNGVFSVSKLQEPKLTAAENYVESDDEFALQNGPILIDDNGKVALNSDTEKLAARTALGVDKDGNVVVIVLHQT